MPDDLRVHRAHPYLLDWRRSDRGFERHPTLRTRAGCGAFDIRVHGTGIETALRRRHRSLSTARDESGGFVHEPLPTPRAAEQDVRALMRVAVPAVARTR